VIACVPLRIPREVHAHHAAAGNPDTQAEAGIHLQRLA
jgi:hypothetical protein